MLEVVLLVIVPAAGGALLHRMWNARIPRAARIGLAVGQIPVSLHRRRHMAVRRGATHA